MPCGWKRAGPASSLRTAVDPDLVKARTVNTVDLTSPHIPWAAKRMIVSASVGWWLDAEPKANCLW